jgi:hypothetical protein
VRRVLAAETWFKAGKVYRGKLTSSGAPADLVADLVALAIELAPRSAWSPQALELRVAQAMGPTWARRLDLLWPVTGCRKAVNRVRKYRRETAGG